MEYLGLHHDESDRRYQDLVDLSSTTWPATPEARDTVRKIGRSLHVLRVHRISIKLETQPAR